MPDALGWFKAAPRATQERLYAEHLQRMEELKAHIYRCALKLEDFGNEESLEVAARLRALSRSERQPAADVTAEVVGGTWAVTGDASDWQGEAPNYTVGESTPRTELDMKRERKAWEQ